MHMYTLKNVSVHYRKSYWTCLFASQVGISKYWTARTSKGFDPPSGSLAYSLTSVDLLGEGKQRLQFFISKPSQKPWCSLPAGRSRGWNLTERRQAEGMKCPLGQWTTVVPVILSWSKPSPTTWEPFGLLHCSELRRETKASSASTRTALPSVEWQLVRQLGDCLAPPGSQGLSEPLFHSSQRWGQYCSKGSVLAPGLLGWARTPERMQPHVQQRLTPYSS